MENNRRIREGKENACLEGSFAVAALEAGLMISDPIGHQLIHRIHRLLTSLALLLRPNERHLISFSPIWNQIKTKTFSRSRPTKIQNQKIPRETERTWKTWQIPRSLAWDSRSHKQQSHDWNEAGGEGPLSSQRMIKKRERKSGEAWKSHRVISQNGSIKKSHLSLSAIRVRVSKHEVNMNTNENTPHTLFDNNQTLWHTWRFPIGLHEIRVMFPLLQWSIGCLSNSADVEELSSCPYSYSSLL